jgi:hypothetical protein
MEVIGGHLCKGSILIHWQIEVLASAELVGGGFRHFERLKAARQHRFWQYAAQCGA